MPRYNVFSGRSKIKSVAFANRPVVLIGRGDDADIQLDNPAISRRHAEIRQKGANYVIHDLSGKNGVFVNGKQVASQLLRNGDKIGVVKYEIVFEWSAEEQEMDRTRSEGGASAAFATDAAAVLEASEGDGAGRPTSRMSSRVDSHGATFMLPPEQLAKVRDTLALKQQAHLLVTTAQGQKTVKLDKEKTVLGKDAGADVKLTGGFLMSPNAAIIRRVGAGYTIEAVGGFFTKVMVGGARLARGVERPLSDGDTIEVGINRIRFHDKA